MSDVYFMLGGFVLGVLTMLLPLWLIWHERYTTGFVDGTLRAQELKDHFKKEYH